MSENNPDMATRITHLAEQVAVLTEATTGALQSGGPTPTKSNSPGISQSQSSAPKKVAEVKSTISTPSEEPSSSTPWSIIVVLIVAGLGLLWLLLKRRA
jgi:hypothetical protein